MDVKKLAHFCKPYVVGLAGMIAVSAGAAESPPPAVDPLVGRLFGPVVAHLDAAAAGREIKTSEFLAAYDRGQEGEREVMEVFASTIERAINWVQADVITKKGGPLAYCFPSDRVMTVEQLMQIVREQVAKNPAVGEDPYSLGILVSLRSAFPCQK